MVFRRLSVLLLALVVLLTLFACGTSDDPVNEPGNVSNESDISNDVSSDTQTPEPAVEITSLELARMMGYGINLGNTMEACDSGNRIPNRDISIYEQMWGQPITTQAMITGHKNAGFKTLRIPVAWTNTMDFENGDLTINDEHLDRVEEIINYALNEDMYVIINDHWDHGWWSLFSHPEQEKRDLAMEIFVSMWTRIAERYKDYDHRLIFEPANEEWGNRFNDKTSFNPLPERLNEDECYKLLTELAQVFVDLVRDTGGKNAERFLLIPGYNTDVADTADDRFQMPVDKANKLMLSVHYYTPWSYCGDTSGVGTWGKTAEVEQMNDLLKMMTKYTDMGYGIVLGEWGVLDNEGPDRLSYFTNFLDNCDLYGYVPMLWDTGWLYDRTACEINAPDIADLFRNRASRLPMTAGELIGAAEENMAWSLRKAANRPEITYTADEAFAWIMFASGDWSMVYCNQDKYDPDVISAGIVATDVEVTDGEGTYTVSLDFTGTSAGFSDGIVFSAVGIINGEILFPGYVMELTEVLINGEQVEFSGSPFTTNDNPVTTRVNLYNQWVSDIPEQARVLSGDLTGATPVPLEKYIDTRIETITVTFNYIAP
ncbi:MAG: glycoside hydrolase family 5 protein [Oscillospiraceae bacterium]|nr:glycoside hydrolase family 5 protein [Oscillospiraceae bacterium]